MSDAKPHWRTPDDTSDTLPDQLRKALAEADSLLANAKGGATVRPRWRTPDDTSDELYVGDRIIAICRWCGHDGRTPETHVLMLTIDEDGVTRDKEGIWYTLQDCDYWMPESEFLRMFAPEVTT